MSLFGGNGALFLSSWFFGGGGGRNRANRDSDTFKGKFSDGECF